jgi:hypothetical protein
VFTRILDVSILLLLGVAIVMPRPDVRVQPALAVDPSERDRVAELQTRLLAAPGDAEAGLGLADIFMDARHPEWALASLSGPLQAHPNDHRLITRRSLALADHFEARGAYQSAARALALCRGGSSQPCGEGELSRLELLVSTLERVKDIDMRKDPNAAKMEIVRGLRPTYLPPKKTAKPAAKPGEKPVEKKAAPGTPVLP